jgi:hypothetical protein
MPCADMEKYMLRGAPNIRNMILINPPLNS